MMHNSCWTNTDNKQPRMSLKGDITTNVAIVGGGMTGILTAYMLESAGIETVVLESHRCGRGTTGHSTAKITAAHRLIYDKLAATKPPSYAYLYASANQRAVERYAEIIKKENIKCDFERLSAFVYAKTDLELAELRNENRTLKKTPIETQLVKETELPFAISGALEYKNQAQFNPYKFICALSDKLEMYENTKVTRIDGDTLITGDGSVTAQTIILCTHYPILNMRGGYFLKLRQEASYALGIKTDQILNGMYSGVNVKDPTLRQADDIILLGGEGHKTGKSHLDIYNNLIQTANSLWQNPEPACFWYAQDCVTPDNLPFIGVMHKKTPHILIATGYGKWGMTSSMVASEMLFDKINGNEHHLSFFLNPMRMPSPVGLTVNLAYAAGGFLTPPKNTKMCTHMGCPLHWNKLENTWDCPCHGSRFDKNGTPFEAPAIRPLHH